MYNKTSLCFLLSGLALAVGCSDEPDRAPAVTDPLDDPSDAVVRPPDTGDYNAAGSPDVKLTSPDSDAAPMVFDAELLAECTAATSTHLVSSPLDQKSVTLELVDEEEKVVLTNDMLEFKDGSYSGTLDIATTRNGTYTLRCKAVNEKEDWGADTVTVLIDHGAEIRPLNPTDMGFVSASRPVTFEFDVVPSMLTIDDEQGTPSRVLVTILGEEFEATKQVDTEHTYALVVDVTDTALFPEPPNGETQIQVAVTDSRSEPQTRTTNFTVFFDGAPPVLKLDSPVDQDLVSGATTMNLTITDAGAGVDWETLKITLLGQEFTYGVPAGDWVLSANKVSFNFNTFTLPASLRDISYEITVADIAGNVLEFDDDTPSADLKGNYLRDEIGPIMMLDPPTFRIQKEGATSSDPDECSHAFNPVGDEAAVNGELYSTDWPLLRTIAFDDTNGGSTSTNVAFYSGVDPDKVELAFSLDSDGALVTDSNNDGFCDSINEGISQGLALEALTAGAGNPYYGDGTGDTGGPTMGSCVYSDPPDSQEPDTLCPFSELSYVPRHPAGVSGQSLVYVRDPRPEICGGSDIELGGQGPIGGKEGWVCVASRGEDKLGNVGVSKPLALCYDNPTVAGTPACASTLGSPPSCTDGCTPFAFPEKWRTLRP